jgi:signal transduction histidine kinase
MKNIVFLFAALFIFQFQSTAQQNQVHLSKEQMAACKTEIVQLNSSESLSQQGVSFFSTILDTGNWPPRWQCGSWSTFHGWLYIISDIIIWISYFMIPLTLGFFIYKKKMEPVPFRSIIILFIAFILACGLTHLIDAAIFWWPAYRLSALIRFVTATVSMGTVFALIKIAPEVIELKSPRMLENIVDARTVELQSLNARLQEEVAQRKRAEEKLKHLYADLERKTEGLEEMNRSLILRERDLLRSEEKVKELNLDLEQKVAERTEQLDASNNELEAFTYSVSHDLRAPLRAINGYARILEEDYNERLDAQGRHLIGVITKNARYMGQLIDDLLEFSRTSKTEVTKSWFDADDEVRRICSDLLQQEKNRKIEIEIKALQPCKADIGMVRQIWVNLVSNALKYSRKKTDAKIEIGNQHLDGEVIYYIKDNGVGFDMEYVDKLFGVFQRLHRKEDFEGTGVGLAIVKRIVDRHGGKIWAEAALNKGANFYFTLPQ